MGPLVLVPVVYALAKPQPSFVRCVHTWLTLEGLSWSRVWICPTFNVLNSKRQPFRRPLGQLIFSVWLFKLRETLSPFNVTTKQAFLLLICHADIVQQRQKSGQQEKLWSSSISLSSAQDSDSFLYQVETQQIRLLFQRALGYLYLSVGSPSSRCVAPSLKEDFHSSNRKMCSNKEIFALLLGRFCWWQRFRTIEAPKKQITVSIHCFTFDHLEEVLMPPLFFLFCLFSSSDTDILDT